MKLLLGLLASEVALAVFDGFPNSLLCILVIAAGLELVGVGESLNTADARNLNKLDGRGLGSVRLQGGGDGKGVAGLTEGERKRRWGVIFVTVTGILAFRNDAVGFLAGMLCHWGFRVQDWWEERRRGREGAIRLEGERGDDNAA